MFVIRDCRAVQCLENKMTIRVGVRLDEVVQFQCRIIFGDQLTKFLAVQIRASGERSVTQIMPNLRFSRPTFIDCNQSVSVRLWYDATCGGTASERLVGIGRGMKR